MRLRLLLSTVAAGAVLTGFSYAEAAPHTGGKTKSTQTVGVKKMSAPAVHVRKSAPHVASGNETLTVSVRRIASHNAVEVVSRQTMDHFVAGTSPVSILAQTTPGALFTSDDAFGLDTVANTLYVRGFNQTQLGATLDGIPMGGQGFHNWNGLGVDQAEIQENISSLTLSQGAGALDTPSAQTLGGAMTFASSDPTDHAGGRLSQLFGSNHGFRTFARVDSGILNQTGTKFYASFARTAQDLWKGYGDQSELQANAKIVQPVGEHGKITAIFDYSNFAQYNYLSVTKNMWQRLGQDSIYLKPNYALAKQYAYYAQNGGVPANYAGVLSNDEISDFAYDGTQIQRNYLSALTGDFELAPGITSKTIAYAHISNGDYAGTNSSLTSPDSQVPMVLEVGHPDTRRLGVVQSFDIQAGRRNDIKTGVWYENNRFQYPMMMYQDGVNYPHASLSDFTNGTTWWRDAFNTNTFQFYLQDTYKVLKNLTVTAGFRSLVQSTHGGTKEDNSSSLSDWGVYYSHPVNGALTAANAFLPHVNVDYRFLEHHEIYVDIAENMRAYDYGAQSSSGSAWSHIGTSKVSAQSVFDASKSVLRPERTWNYVIGYRFNSQYFSGSVDYYHTDYFNRLAAISSGPVNNTYNAYLNVGRESVNGADVLGTIRPLPGLAITNSFSWNDARYQQDSLPYAGSTISIKGKQQVYYPKYMYKADVTYTWKKATVNFNTNYVGSRYMTYTNDEKIPAYWSSTLTASYDFGRIGFAENMKATFGVTNLFNQNYIGGVYGAAAVSGDDNANLFVAAPRQYFGSVAAQF